LLIYSLKMALSYHGESKKFQQGKTHKTLVREEISLLVSSDPSNGATNISANGDSFEINLQDGIKIPRDAHAVQVSMEESTIWWTIPNIITGTNDKFYIDAPRASDSAITSYTVTIPQGLYDLSALNDAIQRELENAGAKTSPDPVVNLLADTATQKVEIRVNYANTDIDFTQADTFRDILGFNSQNLTNGATAPFIHLADNAAAFNTVNSFLIHGDIVQRGVRLNNSYSQILGQVLIDVPPGSQIVSQPRNPPRVSADELAGQIKTRLRFFLTDQSNNSVNTAGEYWTARIVVSYSHPVWI